MKASIKFVVNLVFKAKKYRLNGNKTGLKCNK